MVGAAAVPVGTSPVAPARAQKTQTTDELTLGGEGRYLFRDVATDGAVAYLAGTAPSDDGTAAWVVRMSDGRPTWLETFRGDGDTRATSVAVDEGGGAVVAGATVASGTDGERGWVLAVDEAATRRWGQTFPGTGGVARGVTTTPDGEALICGRAESGLTGVEGWLARVRADGTPRWTKTYGDDLKVAFNDVAVVDGTPRVAGLASPRGDSGAGFYAAVATGGGLRDRRRYDLDGLATGVTALVPAPNGTVLAGTHESERDHFDVWVARVGPDGRRQWTKRVGRSRRDRLADAARTPDGGVLLAARSDERGGSARDAWIVSVDADGEKTWGRTFGAPGDDRADGVAVVDEGYLVAGKRTTDEGSQGWVARRPLDDAPPSLLSEPVPTVGLLGTLAGVAGGVAALRRRS